MSNYVQIADITTYVRPVSFEGHSPMASTSVWFTPSTSEDVVAYKVSLFEPDGTLFGSKDYPVAELSVNPDDTSKIGVNLVDDPDWPLMDNLYTVEIRAIDDAGNLSIPLSGSIIVDEVAPEPPTGFVTS